MKTVCIYHSVDLDGWMSAAIVKHWWELNTKMQEGGSRTDRIEFLSYNYGQPIPDLSGYDKVIMCDISFPKDVMRSLFDKLDNNLIWIDHHISAFKELIDEPIDIEDYSTLFNGLRRTDYAACELTWQYLFPSEPMPEIVRLLGRYDCFGHKGTDEEQKVLEFQYGARECISNYEEAYTYLSKHIEAEKGAMLSQEVSIPGIWNKGKAIYQYLCTEAKQAYKNGFEIKFMIESIPTNEEIRPIPATGYCDICGKLENKQLTRYYFRYENDKCNCHSPYHFDVFDCCSECKPVAENKVPKNFICINKERFNPINFGIDYHKDGYDGCACFHFDGTHWCFSLYNDNGKVDCSVIAKQFGGGGHKGAAGFRLNSEDFNKLIFNNAPINYCIEVRRGGIGEEDCVLHHKFSNTPTKEDIEAYLISEDIGYDSKYCSYDFYKI